MSAVAMITTFLSQILLYAVIALLILSIIWYVYVTSYTKGFKNVKGPTEWPILGSTRYLHPDVVLDNAIKLHEQFGMLLRITVGFNVFLSIVNPKFVQFINTSPKTLSKGVLYRYLHNWLNFGLLTSKGNKWFKRRKLITPAFHFSILEQFIPVFDKAGDILIGKLQENVGQSSFEVKDYIYLCTLDIINETAMGVCVNSQINSDLVYITAIRELSRIVSERALLIRKHFDLFFFFTKDYHLEKKYLKVVHGFTLSVIKTRREELQQNLNKCDLNTLDDFGRRKRVAFLDLLLQSTVDGEPLSNADIQEEVDTFMFEGLDTTATAICFWLYLISRHPEIQEKLVREQRDIYGEEPYRHSTLSDLHRMIYLEMSIKETLRLYPSVPDMHREVEEDFRYGDMTIKRGTQISVSPYVMHRRPEIYPDPENFDPERFTSENCNKRHPFSYLAFSAGGRNCIGQKFAMLEMKCTLGKILRHYEVLRSDPEHVVRLKGNIVLESANGYRIQLKNRKW